MNPLAMKLMRVRSLPLLLLLLGSARMAAAQAPTDPQPVIQVTGQGQIQVAADEASIMIAVETRAATAAAAGSDNARVITAVREALLRSGVPASAISTLGYAVQADMRFTPEGPTQDGYMASNMLRVRTRRLDRVGAIVDTALAAGATRINSLEYTATNTADARRRALAEAIAEARRDAEAMAAAAGGRLGALVELSTGFRAEPVATIGLRDAAALSAGGPPPTPLTPGELTVAAAVSARWRFVPQ